MFNFDGTVRIGGVTSKQMYYQTIFFINLQRTTFFSQHNTLHKNQIQFRSVCAYYIQNDTMSLIFNNKTNFDKFFFLLSLPTEIATIFQLTLPTNSTVDKTVKNAYSYSERKTNTHNKTIILSPEFVIKFMRTKHL